MRHPESSPVTPTRQALAPSVRFYAGHWEELPTVLPIVRIDNVEATYGVMNMSFSEEDFMDGCSSHDGSALGNESSSRRSRKSGSRAWERASENDNGEGGYDVILITDIPYSVASLKKLYALIKRVSFVHDFNTPFSFVSLFFFCCCFRCRCCAPM